MLRLMALVTVGSVGFYMIFVYAAAYLTETGRLTTAQALDINSASLLLYLALTPPAAMLSDRVGRKPMLYAVALGALVFSWPLWWLMQQDAYLIILAGQMGFAAILAIAFAVFPAVMADILQVVVRCSGASLGYNLCLGLVGGTTPLVATYLVTQTGDGFAPVYYLMAAAVVQLIALVGMRETARRALT
jgi:MHS family proline/betaine transporter-like MFS transporter